MGCSCCPSGLGENCEGPLGMDDVECGCDCDCHKCFDCGSACCEKAGVPNPCEVDEDNEDYGDP